MDIEPLDMDDLLCCSQLFAQVFSAPPWNEKWSLDKAHDRLSHFFHSPGSMGWVARTTNNEVIGLLIGSREPFHSGDLFFLREMCIRQGHQRRGIGTSLLQRLLSELQQQPVIATYLATGRESPAEHFYRSQGFKISERMCFLSMPVNGQNLG